MAGVVNPNHSPSEPQRHELHFTLERATKNTYRFQEVGENEPVVGTLYVRQGAITGKRTLRVLIEEE